MFIIACFHLSICFGGAFTGQAAANAEKHLSKTTDEVDLHILSLLQDNCKLSFSKVAKKTGVSVGTAYNRIRNLEEKGVLKSYTILVDSTKIGLGLAAVILVQAEGGHISEVENKIAEARSVIAVYDVTGDFDAAVIARFKDRNDLNTFIKQLLAMPYVKRTVTNVALTTVKEDFRLRFFNK